MRAAVMDDFGAAVVVREVPEPEPSAGEIKVTVRASSLNGFDALLAAGALRDMFEHRFPVVLGKDFAGTVAAVGEGVTGFAPGDRVFGVVARPLPTDGGGFGESLVTAAGTVAPIPDALDDASAGALGLAGAAAVGCLDALSLEPGETVLVCGATGGVGSYLVQLAAGRGATVIATAGSRDGAVRAGEWGAYHVVDRHGDLAEQVRALAPGGVDTAVHLAGDPLAVADLLRPGGRFVSALHVGPEQLAGRDVAATAVIAAPERDLLTRLADDVVAGRLRVPVSRGYSLDEVPRALADLGNGNAGKLSIVVGR